MLPRAPRQDLQTALQRGNKVLSLLDQSLFDAHWVLGPPASGHDRSLPWAFLVKAPQLASRAPEQCRAAAALLGTGAAAAAAGPGMAQQEEFTFPVFYNYPPYFTWVPAGN